MEKNYTSMEDFIVLGENIVKWIREWFEQNGPDCNAIIGMSGGKDSTVAAALCTKALGPDRVIGVLMPYENQGLNDADKICELLGIHYITVNIGNSVDSLLKRINGCRFNSIYDNCSEFVSLSEQSVMNVCPRIRMTTLYAVAQSMNGRVCGTSNLSENYLGYFTVWGDQASDFEPLGDLTATEVMQLGAALSVPAAYSFRTPDDGLPNSMKDEEKFGFSYDDLDRFIMMDFGKKPFDEKLMADIMKWHNKNSFKDRVSIPTYNTGRMNILKFEKVMKSANGYGK